MSEIKPVESFKEAFSLEEPATEGIGARAPGPQDEARRRAETKLLRRLDLRMSVLALMYILNYIDRNNIGSARTKGFETDLHLVGSQYPTAISILFVGYILTQIPSNMILEHTGRPSLYIPGAMLLWGLLSLLTGVTHNFTGVVLVRFFLGFVEGVFYPGALYLLSKWYTRRELGLRTAILYSGSLIAGAFSPVMAAGILSRMEGSRGIRAWRWLFYIEGSATMFLAIVIMFILPDFPANTRWLSTEERALAVLRMKEDEPVSVDDTKVTMTSRQALSSALLDYKTYVMGLGVMAGAAGYSFQLFFPTLAETLGYSPTTSLLLCAPPYIYATLAAFVNCRHSDKTQERFWHVTVPLLLGILGFIVAIATEQVAARYFTLFLMAGSFAGLPVLFSWISNSFPRPAMKRSVCIATINGFSQFGNIAGAYVFPSKWGPSYRNSYGICIACFTASIALLAFHRATLARLNRIEAAKREQEGLPPTGPYYVL